MIEHKIDVIKVSGEVVPFDRNKLKISLEKSGANEKNVLAILEEIERILFDGITTSEIYKKAFQQLKKSSRSTAAKYKLKKAIIELGPTGYPFEEYISRLLSFQGFDVKVGVIVQGHCVSHEIDVVAEKNTKHFMVECKFHSDQKRRCDVKIPLYIQSRFKDVEKQWLKREGHADKFHQGWIVTNTRFTSDAEKFGNCSGLSLISWDYPHQGSLKERIEVAGAHPITSLTSISKANKQKLINNGNVLCMDICEKPDILEGLGIDSREQKKIIREAKEVCKQ